MALVLSTLPEDKQKEIKKIKNKLKRKMNNLGLGTIKITFFEDGGFHIDSEKDLTKNLWKTVEYLETKQDEKFQQAIRDFKEMHNWASLWRVEGLEYGCKFSEASEKMWIYPKSYMTFLEMMDLVSAGTLNDIESELLEMGLKSRLKVYQMKKKFNPKQAYIELKKVLLQLKEEKEQKLKTLEKILSQEVALVWKETKKELMEVLHP